MRENKPCVRTIVRCIPSDKTGQVKDDSVEVHVARYADGMLVGDAYRDGSNVDLWFDTTPTEVARRIIDFASGIAYVTGGVLRRVSDTHFRLEPNH
jgi:cell division inhibitor SepF